MADSRFFNKKGPFTAQQLCEIASAKLVGKDDLIINDVASLENATSDTISFLDNRKYVESFQHSQAGLCLVHPDLVDKAPEGMTLLVTPEPYMGYAKVSSAFYPETNPAPSISPNANVSDSAEIADGVIIDAGVFVGDHVKIGEGTWLKANSAIMDGVSIGQNCIIHPNVTISHCMISNGVTIHAGCQIGQDGFGFASGAQGHVRIPQLGRVLIGDGVNIGANTTIDRGAGPDTVIGAGTQIDNLVQIGHNVQIGKGCVVVSHVGISGSTQLGNFVVIGGQAGIAGHLKIGDSVVIAAKAGVMRDVEAGQTVGGFPAIPQWKWLRQVSAIDKLTKGKK
ncbi:UDP-3-O-(3-hydroxymyristoyl)glucosamine N-acyltransferase [Terasakiella sp. SH-1]|uniref:UDP-3-O-(3-hydroxymyristoyl)glucosamine N-acyltransferase n=1 Tax=Terasakiella sp. SH-1 TaxID=2560057 RepID=UPI00107404F7|nr:UDP-3-O-(3-hydroxymyristoyl)glucosamine N-acyltransferase [Terasakiella sp. SH-1]